ncbi:MAG: CRISPR-associated endoribonuclease Cas6 [Marinoscillum sp.]
MRVRITFNVHNRGGLVPFHHQFLISGVFKNLLLADVNTRFRDYAFYSFSGLKGQTRLSRSGLHYNSRKVTIVISSASADFIGHLVNLVFEEKELTIGELKMSPDTAEEELAVNLERGTKYVCISPLIIIPPDQGAEESKQFVDPSLDAFSDLLYESTITRMSVYGIDVEAIPDAQKFQLVPDEHYLQKIRSANKKFARIYPLYDGEAKMEARGYTFPFTLYAAREIQEFIFTCGLGAECYKGFGMLDLANSNPVERTVTIRSNEELIST